MFQGGIGVKKIFRKNQLVITALALMIAVAGYFSYMNNNMEDGQVTAEAERGCGNGAGYIRHIGGGYACGAGDLYR